MHDRSRSQIAILVLVDIPDKFFINFQMHSCKYDPYKVKL